MRDKLPITLTDTARKQAVNSIRRFFADEFDDRIGDLKATLVLDYILAEHGPAIYNQALADAQAFFKERVEDLGAIGYHMEFPLSTRQRPA